MSVISGLAAAATLAVVLSGQAAPVQERSGTLARLMDCRAVADSAARLACYDAAAGALDSAERQGEVVVMDRAAIAETRREMFGFNVPSLPRLFGPSGESDDISAIETTLQSATRGSDDRWVFRLEDGGVWRQVDTANVHISNRAGRPVRVRRAALGTFFLSVGDSPAVRVRRQ
ncbi:MAG: hypothetical protein ACK4VY_09060 [Brevundimonas sp.]